MKSRLIYSGKCISIYTSTRQAEEYVASLDASERRDLRVAATILDTSLAIGRPPGGRSERVAGCPAGLWELRVTPPGRRGPHTRLLYVREGPELLVVRGVRKAQRGIPRREIELAERAARGLRGNGDDSLGSRNPRGSP